MNNSSDQFLPNVLIVDDIEENLLFIENVIKIFKINLIQALSGYDALEKTRDLDLAMAIIDVRMPGMNGYELAVKINEDRIENKVPIVFITANLFSEIEELKGYSAGAVDYIYKPFSSQILRSKVRIFLDLYNQKQTILRNSILLEKTADELTRTNKALKKSENKFRSYVENAPDGILVTDDHGAFTGTNHALHLITGYTEAEMMQLTIRDITAPESYRAAENHYKKLISAGFSKSEINFIPKNRSIRICAIESVRISHSVFLSFIKDITENKIAEELLKVNEEKYRTMLNASPDGIVLIDLKWKVKEVSDIGVELLGAGSRDELWGKHAYRFVDGNSREQMENMIQNTLKEGLAQNVEINLKKINGSSFLGELSATLIQSTDGSPSSFMIVVRDISQRKKIQAQQIHADRMANLGQMAAGMAHEINQPLNIISMVMDKILFEAGKREAIDYEFLSVKSDKIFENLTRIRNIIDHIRVFSRNNMDYVPTAFSINQSVENAVSMISEQFKHLGIALNMHLEDEFFQLSGNTYQFEQVIINLLTNAKDAVIERKSLQVAGYEPAIQIQTYTENEMPVVEVSDNGTGIKKEDLGNIMLPFFSTKEEGKGTGLGLAISYQIIKDLNGSIDITSTRFSHTNIKLIFNLTKAK